MRSNVYPCTPECSETSENMIAVTTKFWNNDLIWKEIVGYLGVNDLRALASTCTYFFDKCNDLLQFTSSFNVSSRDELPSCFYNLKLTKVNVKLNYYETEDELESTIKDFKDVQILTVHSEEAIPDTILSIFISRLANVISSCPKLKCLTFDSHQFLESSFKPFYTNPLVKTVLSGLTELRILYKYKDNFDEDIEKLGLENPDIINNYLTCALNADFDSFPDLNMKLKVLQYEEHLFVNIVKPTYFQSKILSTSLDSLEEMELIIDHTGLNILQTLQFSKLKKFVIMFGVLIDDLELDFATEILVQKLIPFLLNHISTLQEFKLNFFNPASLKPLCELFKQSQKIKILKFICLDDVYDYLSNTDWKFLSSLTALETFKLKFRGDEEELENMNVDVAEPDDVFLEEAVNWNQFLTYFPNGMKCISLSGFYYHGRQEDLFPTVKTSLSRFTNLTELSMVRCAKFLNDETLQFICSTMHQLLSLKCEFNDVTDFGISGLRTDGSETGISLKNLKRLKKLVIYSGCGEDISRALRITWQGLLSSIVCQQLIKLIIQGNPSDAYFDALKEDSKDGEHYLQLIQQNPCLEVITLSFYIPFNRFPKQISEINPRVNWTTDCRDKASIYLKMDNE